METMKATVLYIKVGSFQQLNRGKVSVLLDAPVTHFLVHRIPISCSMNTVAIVLTVRWFLPCKVFRQLGPVSSCIGELVKKTREKYRLDTTEELWYKSSK